MEYLIAIVIVLVLFFAYAYKQGLDWEKQYKIEIGKYYKLSPEQSAKQDNFNGTCYFDEMISPIDAGIRMPKGEKIFVVINNLNLMAYKSTGNFKFGGVFFRQKIAPALYLRAGTGKFGLSKSWQADAIGSLYVTNKGIFFDGDQKNIKLPWAKIMREAIEPGSIQLEKNNGAPILFNGAINPEDAAKMMLVGKLYEHL
jgi:hypothetical protein